MESISGDEFDLNDAPESTGQEEKIFVAVRIRPLNEKEISKGDASNWECINNNTIVFKNNPSERTYPNLYNFDRVYGCDSSTKQVYDEGVKRIALSVLNGINSTIFAYGQTSSGKTYTMSGITDYATADIYDYISRQNDREFTLKFSAIEIYNENVKDLLSSDGASLRLLDDPEKGTVVEKLTEANLRDCNHLRELIYVCEAERQIGETALNEMSSRSHQILRLTVESSALEYRGVDSERTLAASVNFVDLAGSERASQTLAAGARLKEGCHINRSLLTLGTVIRKLSKSGNGHVPYRNSKLTRILQNSIGGNARTAILCTICPAHSHVEQSRNTLLFASCAKDVCTNAQVNVVMSDKALVKQLQQELARFEKQFKVNPGLGSGTIVRDFELQIEKMREEIQELTQQRDLAQSRLEELILVTGIDSNSLPWGKADQIDDSYENNIIKKQEDSYNEDQNIEKTSIINNNEESEIDDSYENTNERTQKAQSSSCSSDDTDISDSESIGFPSDKQIIPKSKSETDVTKISQQYSQTDPVINHQQQIDQKMIKESASKDKDWSRVFEKQRREIIKLWDECNTPLIHRTYFFLLFKGDQSDSVYMEVEVRRLSFLKNAPSRATSARVLSRERMMLSKKLVKKFSSIQRDELFVKWGIQLDSKHRRNQLSHLLWTKTNDIDHVKDSAEIVAKLVGLVELNQTPKELFGLSLLHK